MAQNYSYNRVQYDTFNITGTLNSAGTSISYTDENNVDKTITLTTCFNKFKGKQITLTVLSKTDQNLTSSFES